MEVLILETFILLLMGSGTKNHGKNLISRKILVRSIIVQIITMLLLINMVLNAEQRKDFGKIRVELMKLILMVGFSGILDTGWVEDRKMIKDKLTDGKKL